MSDEFISKESRIGFKPDFYPNAPPSGGDCSCGSNLDPEFSRPPGGHHCNCPPHRPPHHPPGHFPPQHPGHLPPPHYHPGHYPPGHLPVYHPPAGLPTYQPPGDLPTYRPPGGSPPPHYSPPPRPLPNYPHVPPGSSYPDPPNNTQLHGKGYYWVDTHAFGGVPSTALHGGYDIDGEQIYVGRAFHDGDWIPAKVIPGKNIAYVSYDGEEHGKHQFQVLCEQRFDWVPSQGSYIPPGAVEGGRQSDGEILYIGRVHHDGAVTVGKVHPSHGQCYIPFDGKEIGYPNYEILILRS